jgi:hypothetical protein
MAIYVPYNQQIDKQQNYVFDWEFTDDSDNPIDVSTWSFVFKMLDSNNNVIWNISVFTRPTTSRITFTKLVSDMAGLSGIYSIALYVTNTNSINDQWVSGYYQF